MVFSEKQTHIETLSVDAANTLQIKLIERSGDDAIAWVEQYARRFREIILEPEFRVWLSSHDLMSEEVLVEIERRLLSEGKRSVRAA